MFCHPIISKIGSVGFIFRPLRNFIGFLVILLACSLCGYVESVEVESVIPAYSVGCVIVNDVSKIVNAVNNSPSLKEALLSPRFRNLAEIRNGVARLSEASGINLWNVLASFNNRLAFAQIDISKPRMATIIADLEGANELVNSLRKLEQVLANSQGPALKPNAGTYSNVQFGSIGTSARYAFIENLFIFASEKDSFEAIVDVYQGREAALIHDPKFNLTASKMSFKGEVFGYLNLESVKIAMQALMRNSKLRMLGIQDIKSISLTTNISEPSREQEMYIYTAGGNGLLPVLFANPKPLFSPHLIPAVDADIFCAIHLGDPMLVWGRFTSDIKSILSEREYAGFQNSLSEFEQETGLKIEDDFLKLLTGEIGVAMAFPEDIGSKDELKPSLGRGLIIFCDVNDREKLSMSLERLLANADLQKTEYKGVRICYIPELTGNEGPVGYTFAGNMLIFSSLKRIQNIIDQEPPLVVSENFAQINSKLTQGYGLLFYVNIEKIGHSLLTISPNIPTEESLMRLHTLGSVGGSVTYDGEGFKVKLLGTNEKSWLETMGDLMSILTQKSPE